MKHERANWSTRCFSAASFSFSVTTNDEQLRDGVEELFVDLIDGTVPDERFILTSRHDGVWLAGPDPLPPLGGRPVEVVFTDLVTAVNRQMLDAGADRLHLHAGAVARNDAAVLVSAPSGHGKTTLVTALALRGSDYLSDETVSIAAGDSTIRSFPKPISVKQPGYGLFPELTAHWVPMVEPEPIVWQVPLGRLGVATRTCAEPRLVVLLRREFEAALPRWEQLTPAETVVSLVEQSLDFDRYGDGALPALAELCARCRCVRIEAGSTAATAELIEELLAADPPAPAEVRRLGRSNGAGCSVKIGDEAVVQHPSTGEVVALNAMAARIWARLSDPATETGSLGPDDIGFAEHLADLGFIGSPVGEEAHDVG